MLLKGMLIGLSIAAPVGPIGLLCLRKGLAHGFWPAFTAGLGAATADALYGLVGALGLGAVTALLIEQAGGLKLAGGLFLLWLGWQTWRSAQVSPAPTAPGPTPDARAGGRSTHWRGYLSTFALTATNPMTILSFAAIFAGLGLAQGQAQDALILVTGVFLGSALWWSLLAGIAARGARHLSPTHLTWINRASAAVLGGFGAWALITGFAGT
ncbi:MAG: LysE family translocator [Rhodocyclaceae bacterium]